MITRTGQIELSRYNALERLYGADRTVAIINEVSSRMEREGYLYNNRYTDDQVRRKADEVYEQVLQDWKDDSIPYKN